MTKPHIKYVQEPNDEIYFVHDSNWKATGALILNGDVAAWGLAACSPKDQWCRKIGRTIAAGRAKKVVVNQDLYPSYLLPIPPEVKNGSRKDRIDWAVKQLHHLLYARIGRDR